MKTEYKIIDNFLPKDTFNKLASIALGPEIPYYFNKEINWHHDEKDEVDLTCYFTHALFNMENDYTKNSNKIKNFYTLPKSLGIDYVRYHCSCHAGKMTQTYPEIDFQKFQNQHSKNNDYLLVFLLQIAFSSNF